jgi:hypothetical protein
VKRKREIDREREIEIGGNFWGLESVASPSLSNYGGAGLDPFRGHIGTPARPHGPRVHDGGRTHNLSSTRGSRIPHAGGGIHGGFRGVL